MVRAPLVYNQDSKGTMLSHRGRQLSEQLHEKFARAEGGGVGYRDFRGYLAAVGRPGENGDVMENRESWRMFVDDLGGLALDGTMTKKGMVSYRAETEGTASLEVDLLTLGMPLLPSDLEEWKRNGEWFDRRDGEEVEEANEIILRRVGKKRAEKVREATQARSLLSSVCSVCVLG